MPLPGPLVVKNGSNICASVSGGIPCPVSVTVIRRHGPGSTSSSSASSAGNSTRVARATTLELGLIHADGP